MDNMLFFQKLENYKEYIIDTLERNLDKYIVTVNIVKSFLKQHNDSYIIYENKHKDELSLGIGNYIRFSFFADKIQVVRNERMEEFIITDLNNDIFNIFKKVEMKGWKAYGIVNFSYAKNSFLDEKINEKLMDLFIPNIDIRVEKNRILIRYMEEFKNIVSMVEDCLSDVKDIKESIKENDKLKLETIRSIDEDYYKNIVSKAIEEIKNDKYEKVILSRKINLKKRISFMDRVADRKSVV